MKKKDIPHLTDLEVKIMKVMWERDTSITILEIAEILTKETKKEFSAASITQAMKRLQRKKAVEVKDHVLVSNVYARTFVPSFSREDFFDVEFERLQGDLFGVRKGKNFSVIAALVKTGNMSKEEKEELRHALEEGEK